MALTREWTLKASGSTELLADRAVMRRATDRAGTDQTEHDGLRRLLLLSVNGVAAGLQNTG